MGDLDSRCLEKVELFIFQSFHPGNVLVFYAIILCSVCCVSDSYTQEELAMAETRRVREGYVTLGMAVPADVAEQIRVRAVLAHKSIGDYVASLVRAAASRKTLAELLAGTEGVIFAEGGEILPKAPDTAPGRPQEAMVAVQRTTVPWDPRGGPRRRRVGSGESMTWDQVVEALASRGEGAHRDLAQFLGLKNISVWAKDGVPSKHVPRIREFLAQE
jgi:hypothetical protein